MMKSFVVTCILMLWTLSVSAQEQKKFSPEQFQAELEAFIMREAHFDQQEADRYFPILREMRANQRKIYGRMHNASKPADDAGCLKAIEDLDKANIELKQIDQAYHKKMMQVVSPSKVFDAIQAESRFHRRMMKGWQRHANGGPRGKRH